MKSKITQRGFDQKLHLHILKSLVISANMLCFLTYAFLHVVFYDIPFVLQEELLIALKLLGLATGTAVAVSFLLFAGEGLTYLIRHRKLFKFHDTVRVPKALVNSNSGTLSKAGSKLITQQVV